MHPLPDRSRFLELAADYPVVPVTVEILGDRETPVGLFEKLAGNGDGFLLESVEGAEQWGRWSFVGWGPEFTLVERDGAITVDGPGPPVAGSNPLTALEGVLAGYRAAPLGDIVPGAPDEMPPLYAGAVGFLGYDCVRSIEHLPDGPPDDRGLPNMVWHFVGRLAAFDHLRQSIRLIRNVFPGSDPGKAYDRAVGDLHAAVDLIGREGGYPARPRPRFGPVPAFRQSLSADEFESAVRRAKGYIAAGDAFQIVPSLRLEVDLPDDPFAVYRALRLVNPSPFLFFIRHEGLAIAGSSPELMTRVRGGRVESRPIAGTRPRGETPEADEALAAELLADPKERAEHIMLVDLARNDLGRVCDFGSVTVDELMVVERYSHVMHIVSGVSGSLRSGIGPVDVLRATFPHGTVTGAPKVRAMEIIDELEPTARGPYAGAVGYIDYSGNVDTAIALRTLIAAGGTAWVQAGAGVVADSDPETEYRECLSKAAAVLAAIEAARHL